MKGMTKAELVEENKRLADDRDIQHTALMYLGGGIEPDATERFTAKESGYTDRVVVYLYGAARASGGVLVEVQRDDLGKMPTVRVFRPPDYFEHTAKHATHVPSAFNLGRRGAAEKIRAVWNMRQSGEPEVKEGVSVTSKAAG